MTIDPCGVCLRLADGYRDFARDCGFDPRCEPHTSDAMAQAWYYRNRSSGHSTAEHVDAMHYSTE